MTRTHGVSSVAIVDRCNASAKVVEGFAIAKEVEIIDHTKGVVDVLDCSDTHTMSGRILVIEVAAELCWSLNGVAIAVCVRLVEWLTNDRAGLGAY